MLGHKVIKAHRYYIAEFLGTFILTLVDSLVSVVGHVTHELNFLARCLAPGLTIMALIFALGELSGAHFNPAVTIAFTARGVFPKLRMLGYILIQLLGACAAAGVVHLLFGDAAHFGMTVPKLSEGVGFGFETLLSFILVFVILSTCHQSKIQGPDGAFPVAATIVVCGLIGKEVTGASMNPARSLGTALISGSMDQQWIYALGPVIGSLLATGVVALVHGAPKEKDKESAYGEKNLRETTRSKRLAAKMKRFIHLG